jgi:hypothetical protein
LAPDRAEPSSDRIWREDGVVTTPGLVGRDQQLTALVAAVNAAGAGAGGLLLVTGEAGIGKTALVSAALVHARQAGALVAAGTCWDGEGAPGYWPWMQIVRALRLELEDGAWARAAGEAGAGLGRLLGGDGRASAETGTFEAVDAVTTLVSVLAHERPLVIAIEDLHWADPASVALLAALVPSARLGRLLLVATYRDDEVALADHPLHGALVSLATRATAIPLSGLDADDCTALLAGSGVEPARLPDLQRRTGGNPFFLQQLVQLWVTSGVTSSTPAGVGGVIERRLARLPAAVAGALAAASTLGPSFDPHVLAVLVGSDPDQVVAHLGEARAAGLVTPDPVAGWRFVHDLVREVLVESTPPKERRRRHAAAVRALQAVPSTGGTVLATALANHAVLAIPEVASSEAVDLLLAAAADASGRLAAEEAAGHLTRAWSLLEPDDHRRLAIALDLAAEQRRAGHLEDSRITYATVLADARQLGAAAVLTKAALGLHALGTFVHDDGRHDALLPEARDRLLADRELPPRERDALLARVLGALVRNRVHQTGLDRSGLDELSAEAVALARRSGDSPTLAFTLLARHDAIWEPDTARVRLELTAEMASAARDGSDPEMELQAIELEFAVRMELGDPEAFRAVARYVELERSLNLPRCRYRALSRRATVATLQGRFGEASALVADGYAVGERIGEVDRDGVLCDQSWEIARQRGDVAAIDALLERFAGDSHLAIIEMGVALERGDLDRVAQLRQHVIDLGVIWPRWARTIWWTTQAEIAMARGDLVEARQLRTLLAAHTGGWVVLGGGVIVRGPIDHWLATLDLALGDLDAAVAGFESARASAEHFGARPWVVHARLGLARALLGRDRLGDRGDADIVVQAASTEAAALGMLGAVAALGSLRVPTRRRGRFVRHDDVWTLELDGELVRLPDAKGLRDLHALVASPGRDISAVELLNPDGGALVIASRRLGADAVLDDRAKAEYRARLATLDDAIARALDRHDDPAAQHLDAERDALLAELKSAVGIGGRSRRLGDDAERARKAVTGRIRDVLRRLADRAPGLADHLDAAVVTGSSCRYDPPDPVDWET